MQDLFLGLCALGTSSVNQTRPTSFVRSCSIADKCCTVSWRNLFLPSAISVSYRTTLWHSIRCTTMEILLTLCPNCVVYAWANFIPTVWLKELKFFHTRKSAICICWDAGWLFFATIKHLLLCWSIRHFPFDVRYMWLMPFSLFSFQLWLLWLWCFYRKSKFQKELQCGSLVA